MTSFRILGGEVLTRGQFADRLASRTRTLEATAPDPIAAMIAGPAELETRPAVTQFTPIGPNKPLTILIREVYTGDQPRTLLGGKKPMAVVTGLKDYSAYAASSRAVNFLVADGVAPGARFKTPSTFDQGTNVVAYSPAVLADSLHFTVEIAFDRFPDALAKTISGALGALGGIPLMMPAQGYFLAASTLISVGSNWADALIDGRASFSVTDLLDFNIPGAAPPQADFRVLCHFDASGMTHDPARGLVDRSGALYAGSDPYVVVSLDGAERKSLASFSPTIASAAVLSQFFNMRDGAEASAQAIVAGVGLASDLKYRGDAIQLKAELAAETDPAKKALQGKLDATLKNIGNADLQKLPP